MIQHRVVVSNKWLDGSPQALLLLYLYLVKCLHHNMILRRCAISAVSLCDEAESVCSVCLDIEADGGPVGIH